MNKQVVDELDEFDDLSDEEKQKLWEAGVNAHSFILQLAVEGERSAVIIGAARIEEQLEGLLKAVLVNNPTSNDPLFDSDRALGPFSAKIELAHRFGLITDDFKSALHIVRRIRNQFAHSVEFSSLADPPQGDRIDQLLNLCKGHPGLWMYGPIVGSKSDNQSMVAYCSCLMVLDGELLSARHGFSATEVTNPVSLEHPDRR